MADDSEGQEGAVNVATATECWPGGKSVASVLGSSSWSEQRGYWPTNWNYPPFATQTGQFHASTTKNSSSGGPNLFPDPAAAFSAFELTFPGQSGSRNIIRGEGFFTIDTGLSKRFAMFYNEKHSIQIRAEAFNVTNSVRFEANQLSLS